MKKPWLSSALQIAAIFAFRMLGLFMLIPVFTLYASHLQDSTPSLLGLALGAYGLTQGLLQIPFGMLSDRLGRKPIIGIGLLIFAIGSLVGASSHSIYTMILARTLQGAGAIGSVLIALLADVTAEHDRTKAMAVIGATIGFAFSIAFILSPSLSAIAGLAGLFYLTAGLALVGLGILYYIPQPKRQSTTPITTISQLKQVFLNKDLLRLDAGIFCQHFILVACFYVIPMSLRHHVQQTWHFYLWVIVGSFLTMIPIMLYSEKKQRVKVIFLLAIAGIALSQGALVYAQHSLFWLGILLFLYFVAFNFLEANLPSLISKQAHPTAKGSALGVYSSSQFLGIFAGGTLAGIIYGHTGANGIFVLNALVALGWLYISRHLKA